MTIVVTLQYGGKLPLPEPLPSPLDSSPVAPPEAGDTRTEAEGADPEPEEPREPKELVPELGELDAPDGVAPEPARPDGEDPDEPDGDEPAPKAPEGEGLEDPAPGEPELAPEEVELPAVPVSGPDVPLTPEDGDEVPALEGEPPANIPDVAPDKGEDVTPVGLVPMLADPAPAPALVPVVGPTPTDDDVGPVGDPVKLTAALRDEDGITTDGLIVEPPGKVLLFLP